MKIRKLTDIRHDIILLIGQTVLLCLSVFFIFTTYTQNISPDKEVAERFTISNCKIVDKNMSVTRGLLKRYRADFEVEYLVNGSTFSGVTSANGRDFSFSSDYDAQQEYLNEFEIDRVYPCWFNPSNPKEVVLVLRHNWFSTLPLIIPSVIAFVMIFFIFKSLLDIIEIYLDIRRRRTRKK